MHDSQINIFAYTTGPSFSLPPSKIKDFCHLPRQREAWALRKIADRTVHRKVYRGAPLYLFDKQEFV